VDTSAADEVLLALARAVMGASVRAADRIGGPSPVQLRALTVVQELGHPNLGQLTEALGVTVSTTSRLVDRLVAAGLVDRRPSELTRREVTLSLTPHAAEVLRTYDELRVRGLRDRLAHLTADEQQQVLTALALLAG
jgi:DNA-binding MarR family transcriptional regulator